MVYNEQSRATRWSCLSSDCAHVTNVVGEAGHTSNYFILLPIIQLSRHILPPAQSVCKISDFIKTKNRHI